MLVVGNDEEHVEADLAAGRLSWPCCGAPLGRYGWTRRRVLRTHGEDREMRPRRTSCARCEATHVLLAAWSVPRRRAAARAEPTRVDATRWVHALDPCPAPIEPAGSALGDAIEALGVALASAVRRFGPQHSCGVLAVTAGLLSPDG